MSRKRRRRPLTPKERALLRRKRKRRRLILILAELLVLAVLGVAAFVVLKYDLMNYNPLNEKNLDIYQDTGDYTNIALFGLDSREGELEKGAPKRQYHHRQYQQQDQRSQTSVCLPRHPFKTG